MKTTMRKIITISVLVIMMFTLVACEEDVKKTSSFPGGLSPTFFKDPQNIIRNIESHDLGWLKFYDMYHPENTNYYVQDCEWAILFYLSAAPMEHIAIFNMLTCKDAIGIYEVYQRQIELSVDKEYYCLGLYKNYVICFDERYKELFTEYKVTNDSDDNNQQDS